MAMTENEYVQAIRRARRAHLALDVPLARRLKRAVDSYADSLATAIRRARSEGRSVSQYRLAALRQARQLSDQLERRLILLTRSGIGLAANEVASIMDAATARFVTENGGSVFVSPGNIRGASAYAARIRAGGVPVASRFRTLLGSRVRDLAEEVDWIIQRAIVEGVEPQVLSRRLRGYVRGSRSFGTHLVERTDADGNVIERKVDLRRVPREVRGSAKQMTFNAQRIAVTEMHTAAHETTNAAMEAAPMVEAVQWMLASDRGTGRVPDECDVVARADYYGLGAGVYPVNQVPPLLHPFDRCWTKPVFRQVDRWDTAKPTGTRNLSADSGVISEAGDSRQKRATRAARAAVRAVA